MKITQATKSHKDEVSKLFDLYRQYYGKCPDKFTAEKFISERLNKNDSIIFIALNEKDIIVGFAQVYFSFSSISAKSLLILNDLFVKEEFRNVGVGISLINSGVDYAKKINVSSISLSTKFDNYNA